jgi:hypothetical protein
MLVAVSVALVAMAGFFALLETVTRSSANDQERNLSLVEQTSALHRIAQELGEAYKLNGPTAAGESNYIDFDAWLTKPGTGATQQSKRIVINCEVETAIAEEYECVRYETAITDETEVAKMSTDKSAKSRVDILRLDDGSKTDKVFNLTDPSGSGKGRPTYGTIKVETPGSGERVTYKNQHGYKYVVTLWDSFYMRNLDLAQ